MAEPRETLLHATCLTIGGKGVLLIGPPGSGKSDFALRLIDEARPDGGARLVADDQVLIRNEDGRLLASPPPALEGRLEVRGLGIVPVAHAAQTVVVLAVRLAEAGRIERLPDLETQSFVVLSSRLPMVEIDPTKASAPARLRAALVYCASPREPTR